MMKNVFEQSIDFCKNYFKSEEDYNLTFTGEETLFIRLNRSKVRQSSSVTQINLTLELFNNDKKSLMGTTLSLDSESNNKCLEKVCWSLREELKTLADHPFIIRPSVTECSEQVHSGKLPTENEFFDLLKSEMSDVDLAGYLTSGSAFRGTANSKGSRHWFEAPSFFFDYSLYTAKEKAVKGVYAGTHFDQAELKRNLIRDIESLKVMDRDNIVLRPGKYKVYLAPAAVAELAGTLEWGGFSAGSYQREQSPLKGLKEGSLKWSSKVSMCEDFSMGFVPRFNEMGEVSSEKLSLIKEGKLENLLTSSQTAKEYNLESNFATEGEGMRSFHILPGDLCEKDILKELGTGLYISNLHYLNWSDLVGGRITGMTRFGCLWVENGQVVGPIKDMRFDETLYQIFGEGLIDLTKSTQDFLTTSTYDERSIGGVRVPGVLVKDFSLTL